MTDHVFLPGPFAEADMLAAILGRGAAPRLGLTPAELAGHALRADPRGARVALVDVAGCAVAGALARPAPEDAARLAGALAAMGAGAAARAVATSAGPARAFVALENAAPSGPWPKSPEPEWRAHLAEAAAELADLADRLGSAEAARLATGVSYRALARVRARRDAAPVRVRRGFAAADAVEAAPPARPYARYFAVEEHRLRHRRFDGAMSPALDRAVFVSGDAVTVLPFDPRRGRVLLIEQFRAGPFARRDPYPWCLEAVAGRCDAGEGPEATARREALEEAGLVLGRMERIAGYYTSPGTAAEHITAFVAEADLEGAGGVFGLPEEDEDIRVLVMPLAEATALVRTGEVNNAPLLLSLLWLAAEAPRLTAAWAAPAVGPSG